MRLDEKWFRVIAVLVGGFFAVLAIRIIFTITNVEDQGLIVTFVALLSGSFAIDIYLRINRRWGKENSANLEDASQN